MKKKKTEKTEIPGTGPFETENDSGSAVSPKEKDGPDCGDEKAAKRALKRRVISITELSLVVFLNLVFIFHFIATADTLSKGLSPTLASTLVIMFEFVLCAIPATLLLTALIPVNVCYTKLFSRGWEICAALCVGWFVAEFFLIESLTGIPLGVVLIVGAILPNTLMIFEAYTLEKRLKEKKAEKK